MTVFQKFVVNVECAIECDERFLLIRRPQGVHAEGLLSFPGGKFEEKDGNGCDDVLIQAAKREVYEEVGLEIPEDAFEYVTSSCFVDSKNPSNMVVDMIFHCKLPSIPEELNVSKREVPEYFWLTIDECRSAENCPEWLLRYLVAIAYQKEGI